MKIFGTPESIFAFMKFAVALSCAWPPSKNASRKENIFFELKWWMAWMISVLLIIPLLYCEYLQTKKITSFVSTLGICAACIQNIIKMVICKVMRQRLQFVLHDMVQFASNAKPQEREIFWHYIRRCCIVHISFLVYTLYSIIQRIITPMISPIPFPTVAKYPIPVNTHPIYDFIYIQQSIAVLQITSMLAIDCQMATLFWYIVSRFKILEITMRAIDSAEEFRLCIQQHQHVLWLANEVTTIGKYILLTTVTMAAVALVSCGVFVVGDQPTSMKIRFTLVITTYCALIFLHAWPLEILMRSCEDVGTAVYESTWIESDYTKNMSLVILRSRNPPVVSISGLLPIVSMNYFTKFLSKTFSFFTTLRIVVARMEEINNHSSKQVSDTK